MKTFNKEDTLTFYETMLEQGDNSEYGVLSSMMSDQDVTEDMLKEFAEEHKLDGILEAIKDIEDTANETNN